MLDLRNDWSTLPSRNTLMKERGHRELDFPPSPDVQPKWNIPELVVVGAAVSGRIVREAATGPVRNFALDFDSFQREAAAAIGAGACFVHLDPGGISAIMDSGLTIPQIYDRMFREIDAATKQDWVRDANILRGGNFAENVYPITAGLVETIPMAPNFPVPWMQAVAKIATQHDNRLFFAIHSTAEVELADRYIVSKGLLPSPTCWDVLIGYPYDDATDRLGTWVKHPKAMMTELLQIVDRIHEVDKNAFIIVNASGRAGHYLAAQGMLMGFHVRVGTEDMAFRFPHKDELIESNVETIERARMTATALGRRLATANEFRQMIGLKPRRATSAQRAAE